MTSETPGTRPSLRQKLTVPFFWLVAVPALLGAVVVGAGFFNQQKTRAIADTFVPFSLATLKVAEDTRSLALILERDLSGAEVEAARRQSSKQLESLRENLQAQILLQRKVDATAPALDVEQTAAALSQHIGEILSLSARREKQEEDVRAALAAAVDVTLEAQKSVAPVVQALAEAERPTATALHRIESLVEAAGELRTIAAKLERLAVSTTTAALEQSKQAVMLDIRNATRLTSQMVEASTRERFADALSSLFDTLNREEGLWASRVEALALSKKLAKERRAFQTELTKMREQAARATATATDRLQEAEEEQQRLMWATIIGLVLIIVSSVLMARFTFFVVDREILKPIQRLRETTVALSRGDLEINVDDPATQELAELADALKGFRESARQLKRSNADLEQFAAVASHDLQSPLRLVANYLGIIEMRAGKDLDDKSRTFLQRAITGAQQMQMLIEDLLDFSTTGQAKERVFVLEKVVEVAASQLGLERDEHIFFDGLPTLRGVQLDRLLSELVKNAVKYAGEEQPAKIEVTSRVVDDKVAIYVRDHGIGIPPEHRRRVFEIFKRLQPKGDKGGQGIGLAICKRICEANGGAIAVVETEGDGATFEVMLPAKRCVNTASA